MAPLYTNNTNNTNYTNYSSSNVRAKNVVVADVNIFFNNKEKETQREQFVIARKISANRMDIVFQLHGVCLVIACFLPGGNQLENAPNF